MTESRKKRGIADRESVFYAADELVNRGIYPSQIEVRKLLGGGSFSTIGKYLDEYNDAKEKGKLEKRELITSMSQEVRNRLDDLFVDFYALGERASTTDRVRYLEDENNQLSIRVKELEKELMGYLEMKGKVEALQQSNDQLQNQFVATVQQHSNENAELKERIKALEKMLLKIQEDKMQINN